MKTSINSRISQKNATNNSKQVENSQIALSLKEIDRQITHKVTLKAEQQIQTQFNLSKYFFNMINPFIRQVFIIQTYLQSISIHFLTFIIDQTQQVNFCQTCQNSDFICKMEIASQNSEQPFIPTSHFETILTNRIGYGQAQKKMCSALQFLLFSQGCQSIVLGLLLPVFKQIWLLSSFEQSMLITWVYIGVGTGSYIQSFSDHYGRQIFITWNIVIQCIFGLLSCVSWNYSSFLVFRFFYGVAMGICFPLSGTYITEITPSTERVNLLIRTRYFFSSGAIVTCFLAWYFLSNNSWRSLLFIICLPGIYSFRLNSIYGKESLKYLWVNKRLDQVDENMKFMCIQNGREIIPRRQIQQLIACQIQKQQRDVTFMELLSDKYFSCTIRLVFCWFSTNFIYYGVLLLLPSILQKLYEHSNMGLNFKYLFILVVTSVEVGSYGYTSICLDHPSIGRKKCVFIGALIMCICTIFVILIGTSHQVLLLIVFAVMRSALTLNFLSLYPYTSQVYETLLRAKAMGVCSLAGRFGTILVGLTGVYAINWFNGNGMYYIFIILSGLSAYCANTMPFCTSRNVIE